MPIFIQPDQSEIEKLKLPKKVEKQKPKEE